MMAKLMKTLELHYPMIQFLIILDIQSHFYFHETIIHAFQDEFYSLSWPALQSIHFPIEKVTYSFVNILCKWILDSFTSHVIKTKNRNHSMNEV